MVKKKFKKNKNFLKKKFKKSNICLKKNLNVFNVRSLSFGFLKKKSFESLRRYLSRKLKKKLKFLISKTPDFIFLTKKSQKSRMGKGKGKVYDRLWKVQVNTKIIEISYFKKVNLIFFFLNKLICKLCLNIFLTWNF